MSSHSRIDLDRRRFLATTGALSIGLVSQWACNDDPSEGVRASSKHAPVNMAALPPRVVGLRTLGGTFRFDPEGLLVEPDSDVHWLNMGDFHTVTAFHPLHSNLVPTEVPLRIPPGAEPFHSGMLGLTGGTQFTHRFTVEGVYDYFCQPHYSFGMVGRLVVAGARGGPAVTRPDSQLIKVAQGKLPPVEVIVGAAGVAYEWASRLNGTLFEAANGREPAGPAEAVVEAVHRHEQLRAWVGEDQWPALEQALDAFAEEAKRGNNYESLLQRADEAKARLGKA